MFVSATRYGVCYDKGFAVVQFGLGRFFDFMMILFSFRFCFASTSFAAFRTVS